MRSSVPHGLTCPVRLRVNVAPDSNVLDLLRPESQVTMRWKHVEPALVDATHFMSLSIMIRSEDFVLGETKNRKTETFLDVMFACSLSSKTRFFFSSSSVANLQRR